MNIQKPVLAIDFGLKRIGLAISDSKGIVGAPLRVLHVTKKRKFERVLIDILDEIEKNNVGTIVIGKPQNLEGCKSDICNSIESFAKKLSKRTTLPIIFQDESYSTTQAQNMLLSLGQNSKSTKGKIDMISAVVILQEFLNSNNRNNEKPT